MLCLSQSVDGVHCPKNFVIPALSLIDISQNSSLDDRAAPVWQMDPRRRKWSLLRAPSYSTHVHYSYRADITYRSLYKLILTNWLIN